MNNLKLTTRDQDGITILSCNGRVVFGDESSALRDMVKGLIADGKSNIVITADGSNWDVTRTAQAVFAVDGPAIGAAARVVIASGPQWLADWRDASDQVSAAAAGMR